MIKITENIRTKYISLKVKERMTRAIALAMSVVMIATSADISAYADIGENMKSEAVLESDFASEEQFDILIEDAETPDLNEEPENIETLDSNEEPENIETLDSNEEPENIETLDSNEEPENIETLDSNEESEEIIESTPVEEAAEIDPATEICQEESTYTFEQSVTVDDVLITVTADEGVLPATAKIRATVINNIEDLIDSYSLEDPEALKGQILEYDIKVIDEFDNEIQPDTSMGQVYVAFSNPCADGSYEATDWEVFHVNEAEKRIETLNMEYNTSHGAIVAETEGFSVYIMKAKAPSLSGDAARQFNLANGSIRVGVSGGDTIRINGEGVNSCIRLVNDIGREATFYVYLNEINADQDSKANNECIVETNGYTTNVYFYCKGNNYFFTNTKTALSKTGGGAANVYVDSMETSTSYICFQQSNLFSSTKAVSSDVNLRMAPNGAYCTGASTNIFSSESSAEVAIAKGKSSCWNVNLRMIGRVELYLDSNGNGYEAEGNLNGEIVGGNAKVTLPQPGKRDGYFFSGYSMCRPYSGTFLGVKISAGWGDWSAPDYKPGDTFCMEGENVKVRAEYTPIPNTVNVNLSRNTAKWSGQDVALYSGGKRLYDLTESAGIYTNSSVINGTYGVYVNGAYSGYDIEVKSIDESIKLNQDVKYISADVTVKLDDSATNAVGDVSFRKNGEDVYKLTGINGVYSGNFSTMFLPLDIFVGGIDTGFDFTNIPTGYSNIIDYYTMEITVNDEAPWTNAYVVLKDMNGITVAEPEYVRTEGSSAVYTRVMQKNDTVAGVYSVFIDDVNTGRTVKAVSSGRKADVLYFSSKISMNTKLQAAVVTANNGIDTVLYKYSDESNATAEMLVYTAEHVLARLDEAGLEMPYKLAIGNVVDNERNTVSSTGKNLSMKYYQILYHNSSNTKKTGDGEEKDTIIKRQYVRENNLIPRYAGNVARDGFTFDHWSKLIWSPAVLNNACTEYNYELPVTGGFDLYAVYLSPDVTIGNPVYTNASGAEGGNGKYYRMGNLTISGFDKAEQSIKYIYLVATNIGGITILNQNSIFNNITVDNGSSANRVNLSGGTASFVPNTYGDKIAITFKTPVSMAKAQDFLRNCIVISPKANVANTLQVTVVDASGEYVAANNVTGTSTVSYTIPNNAINIDNYSHGATLSSGTYYITKNKTFSGSTSGSNGLKIAAGATVYLYIPKGVTLTATGKDGSGRNGGYAGILLPSSAKLYVIGEGTLSVQGGKAGNGANGATGGNANGGNGGKYMQAGSGGKGGAAGGGAGAGIGTDGAYGPDGGAGASGGGNAWYTSDVEPPYGTAGANSAYAAQAGSFYRDSRIVMDVHGGAAGTENGAGGAGGWCWSDNGSGWKDPSGYCAAGAGGGGGGGGCGYAGADIGCGGCSGASGGGGAGGGRWQNGASPRYVRNGGGGYGGAGGNGASGGNGGYYSGTYSYSGATDGNNIENWNRGGAGGTGGSKGASITQGSFANVKCSLNYDVSSSKTVTGTYNKIAYTFGDSQTILLPEYTNSNSHVHFLGWEVKAAAKCNTSGAMLTTVNYRIAPDVNTITLSAGTYGEVTLVAVVETFGGIDDTDSVSYTYKETAAAVTYANYDVELKLDGVRTTKGNIVIGSQSVAPSADGTYRITVDSSKAAASYAVKVDDENVGSVSKNGTLTVNYSSISVTVEGIAARSVSLVGTEAPVLTEGASTTLSNGKASAVYTYVTLTSKANDNIYEIIVDGEDTGVTVSFGNSAKVEYYDIDFVINTSGYDASSIESVELRDTDGNRLFAVINGTATTNQVTYRITRFKETKEYVLYVDGARVNSFTRNGETAENIDFTADTTAVVSKIAYTTIIKTNLNGVPAEIGSVVLGDTEEETYTLVRSTTGIYACVITHEVAGGVLPLYIDGRKVNAAQKIGDTTTYDYYTVEYTLADGATGILPSDGNKYLKGDSVTLLTGKNLICGGKTFLGWSVNESEAKEEGNTVIADSKLTAVAKWRTTDFSEKSGNFSVVLGKGVFTYNGKVQIPSLAVYRGKEVLVEGSDYYVSYFNSNTSNGHDSSEGETTNAINAGTVTVKVTGINDYSGTLESTYWISEKEIAVGGLEAVNKIYDGSTVVSLTVDNAYLEGVVEGDDVELSLDSTTGEALSKMAGKHIPVDVSETKLAGAASSNYILKSLATIYVDIDSKPLTKEMFTLKESGEIVTDTTYTYAKNEKTPEVVPSDIQLVNGAEKNILNDALYVISYEDNISAGTAKVIVCADICTDEELAAGERPNYTGTVELEYKINPRPITVRAKATDSAYLKPLADLTDGYVVDPENLPEDDLENLSFAAVTTVKEGYKVKKYSNAITVEYNTANTDYDVTVIDADYTVTKTDIEVPVAVKDYSGAYDGKLHGIELAIGAVDDTAVVYFSADIPLDGSNYSVEGIKAERTAVPDTAKIRNAGSHKIYYYVTSENYRSTSGCGNVNISKATLNVTANLRTVSYGDDITAITGFYKFDSEGTSASGYSANDSDIIITGFKTKADAEAADNTQFGFTSDSYKPGNTITKGEQSYDIIPTISAETVSANAVFNNYDINIIYGKLYVEPKEVTFEWQNTTVAYDGKEHSVKAVITGLLPDDANKVEIVFDDGEEYMEKATAVGEYTAAVASLTGSMSENYRISSEGNTDKQDWKIIKSTNEWTLEPAIQSWSLDAGENEVVPTGKAKYGVAEFAYAAVEAEKEDNELTYTGELPNVVGEYRMRAQIQETEDYPGLTAYVPFNVTAGAIEAPKAVVLVKPADTVLTYGDAFPDDLSIIYSFKDSSDSVDTEKISGTAELKTNYSLSTLETRSVGEYVITVQGLSSDEYELIYVPGKITVNPKTVSLVWPEETEFFFSNSEQGIKAEPAEDSIYVADNVSIGVYEDSENNTNHAVAVGRYKAVVVSLYGNEAGNYVLGENMEKNWEIKAATEESAIFTVAPRIDNWYYGETAPTPVGKSSLGEVIFKYRGKWDEETDWEIFDWKNFAIPTTPGSYSLIAVADNGDGNGVQSSETEFTIYPAKVVITADNKESAFEDDLQPLTYQVTVSKGVLSEEELQALCSEISITSGVTDRSAVGIYDIVVTVSDSENAVVEGIDGKYTIIPAEITFTGDNLVSDNTVVYDAKAHTVLTADITGKAEGITTVYYSTTELNSENYGSGRTKAPAITDAGNKVIYYYAVADNFVPVSGSAMITVTQKELTVTAKDASIAYGDSAPDYSANAEDYVEYSGFEGTDTAAVLSNDLSFRFGYESESIWHDYSEESAAGIYIIRPSLSDSKNYTVVCVDGTLTVSKKTINEIIPEMSEEALSFESLFELSQDGVIVDDTTYTYDKTEKRPVVSVKTGLGISIDPDRDYEVVYTDNINAGYATVTVSAKEGGSFSGSISGTFKINRRDIAFKTENVEGFYNEAVSELNYSLVSGTIVEGDMELLAPKAVTTAVKGSNVGEYEISVSCNETGNYNITVEKAVYTVKPSTLTISAEGYSGIYDGEAHNGTVTVKTGKFLTEATVYYSTEAALTESNYQENGTESIPQFTDVTCNEEGTVEKVTVYYFVVCDNYNMEAGSYDVIIEPKKVELTWLIDDEAKVSVSADGDTHTIKAAAMDTELLQVIGYIADDGETIETEVFEFVGETTGEFHVDAIVSGGAISNYVIAGSRLNYIVEPLSGIEQKENSISELNVKDWEYCQAHDLVSAVAKYGEIKYEYYIAGTDEKTTPANSGAAYEGSEPVNVGCYSVKAYVDETEEYAGVVTSAGFCITKAAISIIGNDVIGEYGKELPVLDDEYTKNKSFVEADGVKVNLSTVATSGSAVGEYPISISLTCDDDPLSVSGNVYENSNYIVTVTEGHYFVTGADNLIRVKAEGYVGEYDGKGHGITVKVTDKSGAQVSDATVYYSTVELTAANYGIGSTTPLLLSNVCRTTIYYYVASDKYAPVSGSKEVVINRKTVTVTPENQTITYGEEAVQSGNVDCTGFISGESLTTLGITPSIAIDYTKFDPAGEYPITVTLDKDADNYNFVLEKGIFTVEPYSITFRWTQANLDYSGNELTVTATAYPMLNNDKITVVVSGGTAIDPGVYTAKVTGLTGAKAGNYTFDPEEKTSTLEWAIRTSANRFKEELRMSGWAYGQTEPEPECTVLAGTLVYTYYTDLACDVPTNTDDAGEGACGAETVGGKPSLPGVYYVKATVEGTDKYDPLASEPVRFEITKGKVTVRVDNQYATVLVEVEEPEPEEPEPEEPGTEEPGTEEPEPEEPAPGPKPLTYVLDGDIAERDNIVIMTKLDEMADLYAVGNYEIIAIVTDAAATFTFDSEKNVYSNSRYDISVINGTYYVTESEIAVSSDNVELAYDGDYHGISVSVLPEDTEYMVYYGTKPATAEDKAAMRAGSAGSLAETSPTRKSVGETTVYYYVVIGEAIYGGSSRIIISKAELTVKANDCIITVGSSPANSGVTYTGFANGEDETRLGGALTFAYDYSLGSSAGKYTIMPGGLSSDNYTITYTSGMLTVEKKNRPVIPAVNMSGYAYGQVGSLPTPSLSETMSENPVIRYYCNSVDNFDSASEWAGITATSLDTGNYYMFAEIGETANYHKCHTEGTLFTVSVGTRKVTAPIGKRLKYNGLGQELVNAGSVANGTMEYSLDNIEYSDNIPTGSAIGFYTIYYRVVSNPNYEDVAVASVTAEIENGMHVVTAPIALNPAYNGREQVLISAGECLTGTILYSLDDDNYYESVAPIKAKEIGTYTVYYKVEGNGDYDAFGPKQITVRIDKKETPAPEYSPIVVPEPTPTPVPGEEVPEEYVVSGETADSVPISATIKDNIATVDEITEEMLNDVIAKMTEEQSSGDDESGEEGRTEEDSKEKSEAEEPNSVTINLSSAKKNVTGVEFTKKSIENLSDVVNDENNSIDSVIVKMSGARVELDAKTLETVLESMEGDTLRLVVEKTSQKELNNSQRDTLSGYNVNRTFEVYFESNSVRIHDFNGGKARVSVSFKPDKGKRVENYKVYYIDENGKLQKMTTKYENGFITFVTSHFSDYAVVYENVKDVLLTEATMTKKGNIKLTWNEIPGASRYVVYGAKCGKSYKKLTETGDNSFIAKKINGAGPVDGKTYKFYVIAYDELGNKLKSRTIHFIAGNTSRKYGNAETIKALSSTLELNAGETGTVGAVTSIYDGKKHLSKNHGKAFRFTSDCPTVVKVQADGTITAKSEGKAVIYIQDISGKWCTVEVTVKK